MYDYRLVTAYMTHHMHARERRPMTGHPVHRVYRLIAERRTPRNERSR